MKKFYFLLLALGLFTGVDAQVVTITDTSFKAKLLAADPTNATAKDINGNQIKVDINNDSQIQVSEALNVYYLDLSLPLVTTTLFNLNGIEQFSNLKVLNTGYYYNQVLNVSMLSNLEELTCNDSTQLNTMNLTGLINLKRLTCQNNINFHSIDVSTLINLEYFNCSRTTFTYTLNFIGYTNLTKLVELNLTRNILVNNTTLDFTGFTQLKKIILRDSNVTSLNIAGVNSLEYIDCIGNEFATLNAANLPNLKYVNCSGVPTLTSLNLNNSLNLEYLNTDYCSLSALNLSGFQNLKYLNCSSSTTPGDVRLTSLNISNCISLEELICMNCDLSNLNVGPLVNLKVLNCYNNPLLTTLNTTALVNLKSLYFDNCNISSINLSNSLLLETLSANATGINFLDVSSMPNLITLSVNSCPNLKSLIIKSGRNVNDFSVSVNYSFNSPSLRYICTDESSISFYQQKLTSYNNTNCQINTYCNFHPGGVYYVIGGSNRFDADNNGCNASDPLLPYLKYKVVRNGVTGNFISDISGNYAIPVQSGSYVVTPIIENPSYFTISPSAVNVIFPVQTSPFTQNFCVSPNGSHPDLEISLLPLQPARPGFDVKYKLIYKNKGNEMQSGIVNLLFNDTVLDLVSANPVASTQTTNNLSWNFVNLLPFETREISFTLNVNSPMETPAVNNGDILNYTAEITSAAIDDLPNDNSFVFHQTAVNSFDPNDKTCLEGTILSPAKIGEYVHYMIRFENTGTYPAQNIVVKDMINTAKFDVSSIVPMKGSHSFVTNITSGNKVEFIFENINLPFDDANNDGYVAFKIKTKPTLSNGDTFSNTASIYFDYNFPIVTNTATTTIAALSVQDFEFSNYFKLYPNPVHDVLNIAAKETIQINSVNIYNTLGQLVLVIPNAKEIKSVDVSSLTSGNYFIKINSDKGTSNTKFIKN